MRLERLVRRWTGAERTSVESRPEWEYFPEGWQSLDPRIKGWNLESIAEAQRAKWPEVERLARGTGPLPMHLWAADLSRPSLATTATGMAYAYVLALAARRKDRLSMLDWGGGIGHYRLISASLLPDVEIDYHCKDVPALCRLARELHASGTFYERDDDAFARDYDLVLACGSLEYSEDWKGVASRLAGASRHYLYVARLPVIHQVPSFPVVQRPSRHGYPTEYVSWVLNESGFVRHLEDLGLHLVRTIPVGEAPSIHGAPEPCELTSFLFARPAVPHGR